MSQYQKLYNQDELSKQNLGDYCPTCHRSEKISQRPSIVRIGLFCSGLLLLNALFWLVQPNRNVLAEPQYDLRCLDQKIQHEMIQSDSDAWHDMTYNGVPSERTDDAWSQIQEVRGVYVTPSEAEKLNLPSSGLKINTGDDEPSATATVLGVQHNIHCIRVIHQVLYPEYYYPNQTSSDATKLKFHAGHCLESLRQSVQCTPDLTPMGVEWEDSERTNIAINPSVRRKCVDWNSLVDWERSREYKLKDLWDSNKILVDDIREDAAYRKEHGTSLHQQESGGY